jgi:hypothetical protein
MSPLLIALIQAAVPAAPPSPSVTEIVDRMVRAENERMAAFSGYTGMRRYQFENKKVNKRAQMTVRVTCDPAGIKNFEVTAEDGSGFVRSHIIRKMMEAEHQASAKGEHEQTRILPQNYDFRLVGEEAVEGRPAYILEISPKTKSQFSVRGRIWVDAEDFAITRLEGSPAKNPSFWIHSVKVVHRYERVGQFWLPVNDQSRAIARVFGETDVAIEYFDYHLNQESTSTEPVASLARGAAIVH